MRNKESLATKLIKLHNVNCNIVFESMFINGRFDVDTNTIHINKNLIGREFLLTLFHEINHAIYCKKMGADIYKQDYELEMERCIISNLDPYADNFYEQEAESFAKQQTNLYLEKN